MLVALLNGSAVTSIRTAAVSALATKLLARQGAGDLALLGAGVQARAHLEAIAQVRALRSVKVASRGGESARRFVSELQPRYGFPIRAARSLEEAVRGADIVVAVTTSKEPVVRREWLSPGVHVNAVGSSTPASREIDGATLATCSLFVDRRESVLNESGDFLSAQQEGLVGPDSIRAEIGEVVIGQHPGRTSSEEITLFKSLGIGIEDVAAARHAFRRAEAEGLGTRVPF
jgi:ornithine cyclodeaminase